MATKKAGMTPEEQSNAFLETAQKLIDAGELNPIEADAALDRMVKRAKAPDRPPRE